MIAIVESIFLKLFLKKIFFFLA